MPRHWRQSEFRSCPALRSQSLSRGLISQVRRSHSRHPRVQSDVQDLRSPCRNTNFGPKPPRAIDNGPANRPRLQALCLPDARSAVRFSTTGRMTGWQPAETAWFSMHWRVVEGVRRKAVENELSTISRTFRRVLKSRGNLPKKRGCRK